MRREQAMSKAVMTRNRYLAAFVATAVATAAAMLLWLPVGAQDAAPGFDGYIQSGTCEAPETEDPVFIELEDARSDYAVEPYLARVSGEDATITLAYYGAPSLQASGTQPYLPMKKCSRSSSSILKAGRQWRAETSSSRTMRTLNRSELRLSNCSQSEIPDFRASQLLSERKPSGSSTSCRLEYKSWCR